MERLNTLVSLITNNSRFKSETKTKFAMAKAELKDKKTLFTCKLDLNIRKNLFKCYTWGVSLYGRETWTLRKVDQKRQENSGMWCCRKMWKIIWTGHVSNKEVLQRDEEERNIRPAIEIKKEC